MAMNSNPGKISTKQKILDNAIHLFAMKGYTETTVRELATIVGVKEASIYNHFPSKNAILECILEEFSQQIANAFVNHDNFSALKENPTADGMFSYIRLSFPENKEQHYLKELYVILQEQHRNPIVRKFLSEQIIMSSEQNIKTIIDKLKEFHILRSDTNPDFWVKTHSSLIYTFASRMLLGIGDNEPDFSGMGLSELLQTLYNMMMKTCGVKNNGRTEAGEGG